MLELSAISTRYGVVPMLREVSLTVGPGELVCLLGPNGAGKTTTFRAVSGLLPLTGGEVQVMGRSLRGLKTEELAGLGVGFVPEARRLFPDLTVQDNIKLGYAAMGGGGDFGEALDRMAALFPRIRERLRQSAGTLSGGEQAMVALARALVGAPKLLIMDEPSLGLSPKLIDEYFEAVSGIKAEGTTIFLIEQNAETALSIADRAYLIVKGAIVAQGSAAEMVGNDHVRHLYL